MPKGKDRPIWLRKLRDKRSRMIRGEWLLAGTYGGSTAYQMALRNNSFRRFPECELAYKQLSGDEQELWVRYRPLATDLAALLQAHVDGLEEIVDRIKAIVEPLADDEDQPETIKAIIAAL
jgi:hypothetical protein